MKFAGFLCFLSIYALSLAFPADPTAKDVQTQSPLVKENEDTRSVFPEELDQYYWSKRVAKKFGYIWRYKLVPVLADPRVPHIEYTLLEDQPSENNPQDLQEVFQENADKTSVDKAMHRSKRQVRWGIEASISIPLGSGGGGYPSWLVQGRADYKDPSFGAGFGAGIGGKFGQHPNTFFRGHVSGTDGNGFTGLLGLGWHSLHGTTFGLGADYRGLGGHFDLQDGLFSAGAGSMPNLDPSNGNQEPLHGSHR